MKNLNWYLLQEAKKAAAPEGYTNISQRGRITNDLKDLLGIESASEINLKKLTKKSKSDPDLNKFKITTPEGKNEIVKDLNLSGAGSRFEDVIKAVARSSELNSVFSGTAKTTAVDEQDGVLIELRPGWSKVAGSRNSTGRFMQFWIGCAAIAVGMGKADRMNYALRDDDRYLLVWIE